MDADIGAAIRWLHSRPDAEPGEVALLGVSMGAEVAIRAAAREKTVRAVVAEGLNGGASDAKASGQPWIGVAQLAVLGATASLLSGHGPGSDSEYLARIRSRPVLLISSGSGSEADANRVFLRRAGPTARLWNLPDASHASAIRSDPAAYERHVIPFLEQALRRR
jgi:dienelactone hydrolase